MDKEEVKDKLKDLYKTLAILMAVVGFTGAYFLPGLTGTIIFFLILAAINVWVIYKIIVRYKDMTRSQRKNVLYYVLFLCLSIIFIVCSSLMNETKGEIFYDSMRCIGFALIASCWGFARRAFEEEE